MIGKICIIRAYSAGVFLGKVTAQKGKEVTLSDARRIWRWEGAATLSQLAMEGTSKPEKCKIPTPVKEIFLTDVIEIIPATAEAIASIKSVPVWTA